MSPRIRSHATNALLIGALITLVACGGIAKSSGPTPVPSVAVGAALDAPAAVPTADVLSLVAAAAGIKAVPKDLTPSLKDAVDDSGPKLAERKGCNPSDQTVQLPECAWGDLAGTHTVILYGDSHAQMWLPAFDAMGKRLHWKIVLLSKASCPPPYTDFWNFTAKTAFVECNQFHDYAIGRINQTNPDLVVMTGNTYVPENGQGKPVTREAWGTGLLKTMNMITSPKTKKVVLGDAPRLGNDPNSYFAGPECLAAHQNNVQACSTPTAVALQNIAGYNDTERVTATQAGGQYIDPFPWFCSSVCTPVVRNIEVYADISHITVTYATFLSGALQDALLPVMGIM